MSRFYKKIAFLGSVLILTFLIGYFIFAWQEPSQNPPGGNVSLPVQQGGEASLKKLVVNEDSVFYATSTFLHDIIFSKKIVFQEGATAEKISPGPIPGLDADTLDGIHLSEILEAASGSGCLSEVQGWDGSNWVKIADFGWMTDKIYDPDGNYYELKSGKVYKNGNLLSLKKSVWSARSDKWYSVDSEPDCLYYPSSESSRTCDDYNCPCEPSCVKKSEWIPEKEETETFDNIGKHDCDVSTHLCAGPEYIGAQSFFSQTAKKFCQEKGYDTYVTYSTEPYTRGCLAEYCDRAHCYPPGWYCIYVGPGDNAKRFTSITCKKTVPGHWQWYRQNSWWFNCRNKDVAQFTKLRVK